MSVPVGHVIGPQGEIITLVKYDLAQLGPGMGYFVDTWPPAKQSRG